MVLAAKVSLLGKTREKLEFCRLFFKSVMKFCSLLSFFCSLLSVAFFSKETKKRGEFESRKKILFCSLTLPSHEREKEEKIHHTTKEEALSRKRFKRLLLLERTLRALEEEEEEEEEELFSFSIVVLLYSKQ